jgi:hypothetical protein
MARHRSTYSRDCAGVALACVLAFGSAFGVAPRPALASPAAAEALFKEGKRRLKAGELGEACRLFAESQHLDPTPGTLLNVAACHEQQGKHATAWAEFLAASRQADAHGDKGRGGEARRRASLLEPKLSHLTVAASGGVPGLVIKRDDEAFDAALLGARLPVDPGEHVITAEAAGYVTFRTSVLVKPDGGEANVDIPPLVPEPKEAPPEVSPAPPAPPAQRPLTPDTASGGSDVFGTRRTAGFVVGGVGVVALGVGAAFGVMALSSYAKADDACPAHTDCTQLTLDRGDRAVTQAWVANISLGVGLASVAAGSYLLFVTPSKPKASAREGTTTDLVLTPHLTGAVLQGRFLRRLEGDQGRPPTYVSSTGSLVATRPVPSRSGAAPHCAP